MSDSAATIATYIIDLLRTGSFSSTYKHATLLGLMDLCLEKDVAFGTGTAQLITTRELAAKVIELYWNQTKPTSLEIRSRAPAQNAPRILCQTPQGPVERQLRGGGIVADIGELRAHVRASHGHRPEDAAADAYEALRNKVEWKLVEMPLPKLEGGESPRKLFEIAWDDERLPKRAEWDAYLAGRATRFDNGIRLKPATAECFRTLHGMLRPYIQLHWGMKVASFNKLDVDTLHEELFGCARDSLAPLRAPLVELQAGKCFYCAEPIAGTAEIDHFVPWSMQNNDCIFNLVATDRRCNNAKRDTFASAAHVETWAARFRLQASHLETIAEKCRWTQKPAATHAAARVLYLALREDAPLWHGVARIERNDRDRIHRALAAVRA